MTQHDLKTGRPWSRGTSALLAVVLVLGAGTAGYFTWRAMQPAAVARSGPPKVPVSVTNAVRKDVPIYLTGLGTVQATFTVGIHSQVDGKLESVFFKEGQHVKKDEVLAKIDPRLFQAALDQAKAKKAQDAASLISLQKDLERFRTLGSKGFETQQNLDQQQAKVDSMKATIQADEAQIETAQTQLDYTDIKAPSDGRMGMRMVDPGNIVRASDAGMMATLVQAQPALGTFTLPAQTLDQVREAMKRGAVEAVAYDRDNRNVLSVGTLQNIDNQIDQATASYKLKASFPNTDEKLWPGEFINVRIQIETRPQAVVVPNTAVQRGPKGQFVWALTDKNTAVSKPIQTGPTTGDITIVESGVSAGDRVITGGQYKLRANSPVSISDKAQTADNSES
ncbi:efflux RND transporter periplasmic adaptor subunit [Rhodoplanes sp. Z2-YC6860]|uniref:efflux RND transporter periplasmic adaptor subunit n=1 Tax=Rhodoplanes sp. Z2-YC6860 TaxID=674703 RepID=UPI00078D1929|nr:efflux RND transporter periplasmic adaptor subunit [Rhodoplanes sp. Z2-YC6860]AMN44156.1 RND family efflux transporter MFP subunit [Rhodoplanes sp. Z2-YC6860]